MSYEQFDKFRKWIENSDTKHYGRGYGNARGTKNISNRQIYLENSKTKLSSKLKRLKYMKNSENNN